MSFPFFSNNHRFPNSEEFFQFIFELLSWFTRRIFVFTFRLTIYLLFFLYFFINEMKECNRDIQIQWKVGKSLNCWITGNSSNAALIALVSTHPDITVVSPRVLRNIVMLLHCSIVEGVITNQNKRVIDICL